MILKKSQQTRGVDLDYYEVIVRGDMEVCVSASFREDKDITGTYAETAVTCRA